MGPPSPVRPHRSLLPWLVAAALGVALATPGCGGGRQDESGGAEPATVDRGDGRAPGLLPPNADAAVARIAGSAGGRLGIAVAPLGGGPIESVGELRTGRAWSTMKVPLLVALVERLGGWEKLSPQEQSRAELAITRSDNAAALALFDRLQELEGGLAPASDAIEAVLRDSGDPDTEVNTEPNDQGFTTFGQTIWSAEASAGFMGALAAGCLLGSADSREVTSLMGDVVGEQRWGLGDAGYPAGVGLLAFKGGWGPEPGSGYLVRQIGAVGSVDDGLVVSIIAAAPGAGAAGFAAGRELVTEAARWVERAIGSAPAGRPAPC
ncbi:MAG TPA: serine hydrolase [Solirubrobacterales bacterium]|nr:serine hydrolase [Solirubrobacterales bacterium]